MIQEEPSALKPPEQLPLSKLNVAILMFPGVEVLDFAGPYEVFARTRLIPGVASRRDEESAPFTVFTVSKKLNYDNNLSRFFIEATGGLKVVPDFDFTTSPKIDLLVIPGGFGTRALLDDSETLDWIQQISQQEAKHVSSVCTGALLLASLGLLHGQPATTHWGAHDTLAALDPSIAVDREGRRVVRTATGIWTSAGVSAGIDMSFHIVEELCGKDVADETAQYIEYQRR